MAKLDMKKMAGSDRIKANTGVLPSMAKPLDTKKEKKESKNAGTDKEQKSSTPATATPTAERAQKEQVHPATADAAAPAATTATISTVSTPAEDAAPSTAASPTADVPAKKRRGRPQIRPILLNDNGEKLTITNVALEDELQRYLEFCLEKDGTVTSKAGFIRKLVHNSYEKNFEAFHEWEIQKKKGSIVF